jgi:hypothetical protein
LILSIEALAASPSKPGGAGSSEGETITMLVLPWSPRLRIEIAALLALFALVLVYDRPRPSSDSNQSRLPKWFESLKILFSAAGRSARWPTRSSWVSLAMLVYPASIFLIVFPNGGVQPLLLGFLALLIVSAATSLSLSQKPHADDGAPRKGPGAPTITFVAALCLGAGGFVAVDSASADWQLVVGVLAAVLPLLSNFRRRKEAVRAPGPVAS